MTFGQHPSAEQVTEHVSIQKAILKDFPGVASSLQRNCFRRGWCACLTDVLTLPGFDKRNDVEYLPVPYHAA